MKPIRIQLSRKKGWRKPENTVVVSRPTKWGNPIEVWKCNDWWQVIVPFCQPINVATRVDAHAESVRLFEAWVNQDPCYIERIKRELKGKNLACWCPLDCACHADVLLRIANSP